MMNEKKLTKSNILALDMAERTGVFSQQFKGVWHFPKTGKQPKHFGDNYQRETYFINKKQAGKRVERVCVDFKTE